VVISDTQSFWIAETASQTSATIQPECSSQLTFQGRLTEIKSKNWAKLSAVSYQLSADSNIYWWYGIFLPAAICPLLAVE
jgi:hypothetical protein